MNSYICVASFRDNDNVLWVDISSYNRNVGLLSCILSICLRYLKRMRQSRDFYVEESPFFFVYPSLKLHYYCSSSQTRKRETIPDYSTIHTRDWYCSIDNVFGSHPILVVDLFSARNCNSISTVCWLKRILWLSYFPSHESYANVSKGYVKKHKDRHWIVISLLVERTISFVLRVKSRESREWKTQKEASSLVSCSNFQVEL